MAALGSSSRNDSSASGTPHTTPDSRATSVARDRRSDTTVAMVVMSLKAPSSCSAVRTVSESTSWRSGKCRTPMPFTAGTESGVIVRGTDRLSRGWGEGGSSDIPIAPPLRCLLFPWIYAVRRGRQGLLGTAADGHHPVDRPSRSPGHLARHGDPVLVVAQRV